MGFISPKPELAPQEPLDSPQPQGEIAPAQGEVPAPGGAKERYDDGMTDGRETAPHLSPAELDGEINRLRESYGAGELDDWQRGFLEALEEEQQRRSTPQLAEAPTPPAETPKISPQESEAEPQGAGAESTPQFDRTVPETEAEKISAIRRIINIAKQVKDRVERAVIGGITNRQAKDFKEIGLDIDDTWVHSIENSAINHNQNHHGNATTEEKRGQIAITDEDYTKIPDIIENYDRVGISSNKTGSGNDVIVYEKEYGDGYVYYLEEKRDNRKSLAFQTMYKKKKGADSSDGLLPNATPFTSKTTPDNLSDLSDGKDIKSSSDSQIPTEKKPEPATAETPATLPVDPEGREMWEAVSEEHGYRIALDTIGDEQGVIGYLDSQLPEIDKAIKAEERKEPKYKEPALGGGIKSMADYKQKRQEAREDFERQQAEWEERVSRLRERKTAMEAVKARTEEALREKTAAEENRRRQEAEAARMEEERQRRLQEQKQAEEEFGNLPDWTEDRPAEARKRGAWRVVGEIVRRAKAVASRITLGQSVDVKFSRDDTVNGYLAVMEADDLQPSHIDGETNPRHFIPEAQPKDRRDTVSRLAAMKIAQKVRPEEITGSITAYTGAPSVNARGEVIQGNNRGEALKLMYEEYSDQAEIYRRYLMEHARELGLDPEKIASMRRPVLVNMLDVSDQEAIRLGGMTQADLESGGVERIKAENLIPKLGDRMADFMRMLMSGEEDKTLAQLIDDNGIEAIKWLNMRGYISDTQLQSAFHNGTLSAEAKNDLEKVVKRVLFEGGSKFLEQHFSKLPAASQRALLATAFRDMQSPESEKLVPHIQRAVEAYSQAAGYDAFAKARNFEEALRGIMEWSRQSSFDEIGGEPVYPAERFSEFELVLAAMMRGKGQRELQSLLNRIYEIVQGTKKLGLDDLMFGDAEAPKPKTLAEAAREVLEMPELKINRYDEPDRKQPQQGEEPARGRENGDGSPRSPGLDGEGGRPRSAERPQDDSLERPGDDSRQRPDVDSPAEPESARPEDKPSSEAPAGVSPEANEAREPEAEYGREGRFDPQGNPIDEEGKLVIEEVGRIDEITDEDFIEPIRSIALPALPKDVQRVLSTKGKRVIIKKNILERNALRHSELTPEQSRAILKEALYNPTLYGQNKPLSRPNNWIVISVSDGKGNNKLVVVEVNDKKENIEIVHWYEVNEKGLEKIRKQAEREDGQLLILPSGISEEAGALSGPTSDKLSGSKGSKNSPSVQDRDAEYGRQMSFDFDGGTTAPRAVQRSLFDFGEATGTEGVAATWEKVETQETEAAAERANAAIDRFGNEYSDYKGRLLEIDRLRGQALDRMDALRAVGGDEAEINRLREDVDRFDREEAELDEELHDYKSRLEAQLLEYYSLNNTPEDAREQAREMANRALAEIEMRLSEKTRRPSVPPVEILPSEKAPELKTMPTSAAVKSADGPIGYDAVGHLPDKEKGEFCTVERQYILTGRFGFTGGDRIESHADVAYLMKSLESKAVEHVFAVMIKDGKARVVFISQGGPVASLIDFSAIQAGYDAFGADEVYLVHNHPSGNLNPSVPDRDFMRKAEEGFKARGVKVHGLIVDTDSGRYTVFDSKRKTDEYDRALSIEGEQDYEAAEFSEMARRDNVSRVKITGGRDVADYVRSMRFSREKKVNFLILSNSLEVVGNIRTDYESVLGKGLAAEIAGAAVKFGGRRVIIYGDVDIEKSYELNDKVTAMSFGDIQIIDAVRLNDNSIGGYEAARDKAWLSNEPTADTGVANDRSSMQLDNDYPGWLDGTTTSSGKHTTQVEGTRKTYRKIGDWIERRFGKKARILDASSGLGYGTSDLRERGFDIEDVEPYQSEERRASNPATYESYDNIRGNYDVIISNAVLNVLPENWRRQVLHDMASRLKKGGTLFINTRKAGEEKGIKDKIELDSPQEVLVRRNGRIASYQRFFTPKELKAWVESELGEGYKVEIANEDNSGTKGLSAVVVTKEGNVVREISAEYGNGKKNIKSRIKDLFIGALSGLWKGKPQPIGILTVEGKKFLENLSGIKMRDNVTFALNPSDMVHIYNRHFGDNEKDGRNLALNINDISNIVEVIENPDRVLYAKEKDGNKRNLFFFLKEGKDGSYNLLEVYADRHGNLTSKSYYKSKESVSQRVMSLKKIPTLNVRDGWGNPLEKAKLPKFFETDKFGDEGLSLEYGPQMTSDSDPYSDPSRGVAESTAHDAAASYGAGSLRPVVDQSRADLEALHREANFDKESRSALGPDEAPSLKAIRRAMMAQRAFDRETAAGIADICRSLIQSGQLSLIKQGEVKRLLSMLRF